MGIVGFSLPRHDEYVRQALYRLTQNFTGSELEVYGVRQTKLALIDYGESTEDKRRLTERYQFLNWNRVEPWFDGFNEASFQVLFADEYTPGLG